jgi:hypothetical protein
VGGRRRGSRWKAKRERVEGEEGEKELGLYVGEGKGGV